MTLLDERHNPPDCSRAKAKAQTALEISHTFTDALDIQNTTGALWASFIYEYNLTKCASYK